MGWLAVARGARRILWLVPTAALAGCSSGVLDPHGPVGAAERTILFNSVAIMLIVVVPVIAATLGFAWWYRASNPRARRLPDWEYSGQVELFCWSIPTLVVIFVGGIAWIGSHDLDPYVALQSPLAPLEVEVVSLDWKWLFIYPKQGIASVNELVVPAGRPIHFRLTSATVMNSFFVPQLGSQIYTMAGMTTQLNLRADEPGVYAGLSAQFSGDGFADMNFQVRAVDEAQFAQWTSAARAAGPALDANAYEQLRQPAIAAHGQSFGSVDAHLFSKIVHSSMAPPMRRCRRITMLGKLDWSAFPLHEPIALFTALGVLLVIVATLAWIVLRGHWPYLWREWITTVDHKRIGVMYFVLGLVMLLRGFADALMMRSQQAIAYNSPGYLPPDHFDQIFSAHGTIMIFFVAMPFMIGLMNFVVPLQLGARDVAFPTFNSVSFWLSAAGVLLINLSLGIGNFARTGWLAYPPLSELAYSPDVGVDYYLWSLQISGIGTLLTGINFVTTILKMRAPGMRYTRMPVFCWTALASNLLIVAAFPILTATFAMLLLDRYLGFHFFTNDFGGNPMMYINLIWTWGHPEVYILILPAFGVFSEVISTFSGKPLFGYRSMIAATMAICLLSFMVWLHHFFTMGAGADVNGFFGVATMIIAVPTGVKVFNWLFTLYGGSVRFTVPVLWALGFMVTFVIGGMTGVLMAVPPADFVLHNSLFLVAHFHNVIIGGVVFGAFAGYAYWFPKVTGFMLHEGWGRAAFWLWIVGFYLAFMPLYALGLMGMTRRMQHYDVAGWQPWLIAAAVGALLILAGITCQIVQLVVSIRTRAAHRDITGDPWDGRSLEWSTLSPPPAYNFAVLPQVHGREQYWDSKQMALDAGGLAAEPDYKAIEVPRNSPTGFVAAFFATVTGFALIWHIWWMVALGLLGAFATFVAFAWRDTKDGEVSASEVARADRERRRVRADALAARGAA